MIFLSLVCMFPPANVPPLHLTAAQGSAWVAPGTTMDNLAAGLSPGGLPWGSSIDSGAPGLTPLVFDRPNCSTVQFGRLVK
jgi:hypothetical protein